MMQHLDSLDSQCT